jgi:hypothetical protein
VRPNTSAADAGRAARALIVLFVLALAAAGVALAARRSAHASLARPPAASAPAFERKPLKSAAAALPTQVPSRPTQQLAPGDSQASRQFAGDAPLSASADAFSRLRPNEPRADEGYLMGHVPSAAPSDFQRTPRP